MSLCQALILSVPPFFCMTWRRSWLFQSHPPGGGRGGWPPPAARFFASSEPMDITYDALVAAEAYLE